MPSGDAYLFFDQVIVVDEPLGSGSDACAQPQRFRDERVRLPKRELVKRLAVPARVPLPRADRALTSGSFDSEEDFVNAIDTLETMRRSL